MNHRSLPSTVDRSETTHPVSTPSLDLPKVPLNCSARRERRGDQRSSSDGSIDALVTKYATPPISPAKTSPSTGYDDDPAKVVLGSPTRLRRLPLRSSSSPLRPSQWTSRGGLLSPPRKSQTSTPDRFIHCRRPPAITRESFELNKPNERGNISQRGHRTGGDPFSRRVRRSDRLDAELRGLRESHAAIAGRPGGDVRSPNSRIRSSSLTMAARQISAGAVWNVGGSSAVSDTVTAVSNGRGGMLGSGTVAPLYTSTFLNRADPEAEMEAYERRLALALEVDQTDRILQHSPLLSNSSEMKHEKRPPYAPHFWRDGAWTQDGVEPRLFYILPGLLKAHANKLLKRLDDHSRIPEGLCQSYLSDKSQSHRVNFSYVNTVLQSLMRLNCETTTTAPCLPTLIPPSALQ